MRLTLTLAILAAGVTLSLAVWAWTGGGFALLFLPLILGLPFVWRRRS